MTEIAKYRELVTELRESAEEWLNEVRTRKQAADAISTLLDRLEASELDAGRYRGMLDALMRGDIPMSESSVSLNVAGVPPTQEEFDEAVDFFIQSTTEPR